MACHLYVVGFVKAGLCFGQAQKRNSHENIAMSIYRGARPFNLTHDHYMIKAFDALDHYIRTDRFLNRLDTDFAIIFSSYFPTDAVKVHMRWQDWAR